VLMGRRPGSGVVQVVGGACSRWLYTALDADQLLVLNAGELVEAGRPQQLAQQPGSMFDCMVAPAGAAREAAGSSTAAERAVQQGYKYACGAAMPQKQQSLSVSMRRLDG